MTPQKLLVLREFLRFVTTLLLVNVFTHYGVWSVGELFGLCFVTYSCVVLFGRIARNVGRPRLVAVLHIPVSRFPFYAVLLHTTVLFLFWEYIWLTCFTFWFQRFVTLAFYRMGWDVVPFLRRRIQHRLSDPDAFYGMIYTDAMCLLLVGLFTLYNRLTCYDVLRVVNRFIYH